MVGRGGGGKRRRSVGLALADVVAIILVIAILGSALGVLLGSRDPRVVAGAQERIRLVVEHLSPSLLLPNQAAAESPQPTASKPAS